ncbi:zinc finger protein 710a isoform X2 [Triplophysa dalaica]|uniref:zinc finger protein 710a isoform X2 n=1 Tax=Triplophysa dalaica TaxID=1582913 RepID=UPI0024DF6C9B|nr:zinc finger protein 710a isoform X2 [Triplophysa dalaica]XP_056622551.1 zinc finger protein 710a isoform X2 [Triplophysa dalaica]
MRSLKHLKHHTRSNVEEQEVPLVSCYSKVMEHGVDAGTQTDPVVVLSLAQAAVLGLISQNEIFGATIAPKGFCKGMARDGPAPPAEAMEYEYADQLIGANGDYLSEPHRRPEGLHGAERRRPGPRGRTKRPFSEVEAEEKSLDTSNPVKGERMEFSSPCYLANPQQTDSEPEVLDLTPNRVPVKEENCTKGYPESSREPSDQQVDANSEANAKPSTVGPAKALPVSSEEERGKEEREEEDVEERALNLKTKEEDVTPVMRRYYESSVIGYETAEMSMPGEYEEGGQSMVWTDAENSVGRRMQIDRLDINVQIDESYCVDVGEGLKRWKCRMCEKSYTSKYNLVTHILGHNGIKPHECVHCGKLFKQPSHLQTHLLTHQGTRPHKCTVCKKAFTQTSHLKRHMLQHSDIKPYSCRFCGRGFAYPSELRTHETKHESGHCHVCAQCGMEFPTQAHLKRHQVSHQGPTTFQCSECHKSFAYRSQLQNHLMKHQNVRPFVCSECGMEFVQIHHLKQHMLRHKGMKEYKCEVCSREFTLSANLKRHMLIHTSVRPFQCHVCFKTFVQKQTLKTHMIVHLPVKPFKCKVCGKSFNRMYNLLGHMHLHAGSKPFKCPYCSSKFNLKGNLSRHMKVKHGILDTSSEGQDVLHDVEGHEDYEAESFDYSERENLASNNSTTTQDLAKLGKMSYYNYTKVAARYNTA